MSYSSLFIHLLSSYFYLSKSELYVNFIEGDPSQEEF